MTYMEIETSAFARLSERIAGSVVTPDDARYDGARQAWNALLDQRPAAVVLPETAADVAAVVRFAAEAGLRVAPQSTGHNAGPLGSLEGTILLRTDRMRSVEIDVARRIARVQAGALWDDVVTRAVPHGLTALHGSSPDVGVAGYALGGGIGWLARRYGMATNSVTAVELVTAAGDVVRADRDHEPDLFWAVRGGGGNFGVVTSIELALLPVSHAYAGWLIWDWQHSADVLAAWADWAPDASPDVTTSLRILQLPPAEFIPEPLRGRNVIAIDGAVLGGEAGAIEQLRPLRALKPEMDTFATVPAVALARLHGDPEGPTPIIGETMSWRGLGPDAVDAFVDVFGPESGSPYMLAEIRQLGGALAEPHPTAGANSHFEVPFLSFFGGVPMAPGMVEAIEAHAVRIHHDLAPFAAPRTYLNFAEQAADAETGYPTGAYARLQRIRAQADPTGLFRSNHEIALA